MDFIRFIFSGFWTWLGFLIMIGAVGEIVVNIAKTAHTPRKIEAYRIGNRRHVQIDGARRADIAETLDTIDRQNGAGVEE